MEANLRRKLWSLSSRVLVESPYIIHPGIEPGLLPFWKYFSKEYSEYFLELGSGWGEVVLELATQNPETGYLAIERKWNRLLQIEREIQKRNLKNLLLSGINFQWFLDELFPEEFFQTILLNFPDPWPKKKHHKNRAIRPEFLENIHKILKPGGKFLFATDHLAYFRHALRTFRKSPLFRYEEREWTSTRENFPVSRFEMEKQMQGKRIFYLERVRV